MYALELKSNAARITRVATNIPLMFFATIVSIVTINDILVGPNIQILDVNKSWRILSELSYLVILWLISRVVTSSYGEIFLCWLEISIQNWVLRTVLMGVRYVYIFRKSGLGFIESNCCKQILVSSLPFF